MNAIEFENVGKQYRLGLVSTGTISHDLKRWWAMNVLRREDPYLKIGEINDRAHRGNCDYVWALKGISFSVEEGDVVGIIGKNGAGKSTLLNKLVPGLQLRTAAISEAHNTGMHTTTFSEMIPYADGAEEQCGTGEDHAAPGAPSWLIDTPGIKGFGTFDMEPEEICGYFRDIFRLSDGCRFSNCTHTHEPGCAVLAALEAGTLAPSRYESYLSMLNDKEESKYREAF